MKQKTWIRSILLLAVTVMVAAGLFVLLFHYDNKYTGRSTISQEGWTFVSEKGIYDPAYLVDGWELYPDALLTPEELAAGDQRMAGGLRPADGLRPIRTFVGEYLNLAPLHDDGSPYGEATWRLRIRYDGPAMTGTLLLPEVFCAFRLYVNGEELASQGSIDPYRPLVQDTVASFPLLPENEIVVQTANYSHYYSGVTYPPVLGATQTMWTYTVVRLVFYGFLCFGTLAAALFSIAFWLGGGWRRDRVALLFGALAAGFAVWVSYPFSRLLGIPLIRPLYALEDASFLLVLWCTLRIALHLCKLARTRWGRHLSALSFAMLLVSILVPLLVLPTVPGYAAVYGVLITLYELLASLTLAGLALYGSFKMCGSGSWMLCGAGFLATGLLAGALTVYSFEPAQFGWFEEYGAFALVVCFGILMVQRSFGMVRENRILNEHLQEEVARKTREMGVLVSERDDLISKFLHDLKSPTAVMNAYAHMVRQNNIALDENTRSQLAVIEEKCADLGDRVRQVQQYTVENPLITPHKDVELCTLLQDFYTFSKPDVEMDGQNFRLELPDSPCRVSADSDKLERMLQNLIYNAVAYTPADGEIRLVLTRDDENAYLSVQDTGSGIEPDVLPHIFERFYTTRAEDGGSGLGLYIVRTIAREHGGEVSVQSHLGKGTNFIVRLPLSK